ncbi:MAG: oligosaccharide flippase family protein [Polyangiaceae bacterium]
MRCASVEARDAFARGAKASSRASLRASPVHDDDRKQHGRAASQHTIKDASASRNRVLLRTDESSAFALLGGGPRPNIRPAPQAGARAKAGHAVNQEPTPIAEEPIDRHEDLSVGAVDDLKRRARWGVVILAGRTVLVQLTVLGGQVALARLLDPRDFGVYAIVQFALSFFVLFGDAGLGGGLIQQKTEPSERELSSVFWFQVLMALAVIAVVFTVAGLAPLVWKELPEVGPWLLRALSLQLMLTALRVVPCILMERELQFGKLATLDLALSATFYIAAVGLAWRGWGVWSLILAVVAQGGVGLIVAYILRPFRPMAALDRQFLRGVLRFGVPFQLNYAVGFINGAVTPLYAGAKLGAHSLGLLGWAQNTAYFPLKLVEIVGRVAFPLYSRLQNDKRLLGESFGRSVQLCASFTAFFVALFLGMGEKVITIVFSEKWMPALVPLYIYSCAIAVGFLTPLVVAVLESTGRPRLALRLSLCWTALNWVIVPIVGARWGTVGFALAYCAHVVLGNLFVMALTSRLIPHARLLRRLWSPALGGCVVYGLARYVFAPRMDGGVEFVGAVVALVLAHAASLLILDRRGFIDACMLVPNAKASPA